VIAFANVAIVVPFLIPNLFHIENANAPAKEHHRQVGSSSVSWPSGELAESR
jgi:hypothetical protein